jgi:hypothetical protein
VGKFELGVEEVGLQPRHGFGVEAVLAERVGGWSSEGDIGGEVSVEGVLVLLLDGRVGQRRVDDRHVGRLVAEHSHDRPKP